MVPIWGDGAICVLAQSVSTYSHAYRSRYRLYGVAQKQMISPLESRQNPRIVPKMIVLGVAHVLGHEQLCGCGVVLKLTADLNTPT